MLHVAFWVLTLSVAVPHAQDQPSWRGSHETSIPANRSAGFTLDKLNGLPRFREPIPTYPMYSPPYPTYGWYPYSPPNAAYSYPHPFGLGGYDPPRAVGSNGLGLWLWIR